MYYRIAEILLESEFRLPSYSAFACDPGDADVTLKRGTAPPDGGQDLETGELKVRRLPEGWYFRTEAGAGMAASADYTRLCLTDGSAASGDADEEAERLLRVALECLLIRRGYLSVHGAAVSADGEAWLFTGMSGMGKSTRARAWQEAFGAQMISGDRPLIRVSTMEVYGVPWDGKEQCFRNVRYPLKMICEVRRSETDYLRATDFGQRRSLLFRQCFLPMWDTGAGTAQMMNLIRLARGAQIVRMFSGPRPEDAKILRTMLEEGRLRKEEPDMRLKNGFVIRNVMGDYMLMPAGDNVGQFRGTVALNGVAAFVVEQLQNPVSRDDLLTAVRARYDVEESTAARDLDALLEKLKGFGIIGED